MENNQPNLDGQKIDTKNNTNWKNVLPITLITFCFLAMYFYMAGGIGWGVGSNLELGWIFVLLILVPVSFALSLASYIIIYKGTNPLIVLWCLFFDLIADVGFYFYVDTYHRSNNIFSYSALPILFFILLTVLVLASRAGKDLSLLKLFLVSLAAMILIGSISYYYFSDYSSKAQVEQSQQSYNDYKKIIENSKLQSTTTPANILESQAIGFTYDVVDGLKNIFVPQGKEISSPVQDMWWQDKDGLVINVRTPHSLDFNIDVASEDAYPNEPNKNQSVINIIKTVNDYAYTQGLDVQEAQSTSKSNPNIVAFAFTQAYSSSENSVKNGFPFVRCRLTVYDPNLGVGETAPFIFTINFSCASDPEYKRAYDEQAPYIKGLKLPLKDIIVIDNNFSKTCVKESSLNIIEIVDLTQGSTNYYSMKNVNGSWIDMEMSGYQIAMTCGVSNNK